MSVVARKAKCVSAHTYGLKVPIPGKEDRPGCVSDKKQMWGMAIIKPSMLVKQNIAGKTDLIITFINFAHIV